MANQTGLKELYIDELRDLYSAETQIVKALPELIKTASSEDLKHAFQEHLDQTHEQVKRLEQIFGKLEEPPTGKSCKGMQGVLAEGKEMIKEDYDQVVKDAGLISAAQRVEHYEMAGYGSVISYAELLGDQDAVNLLNQTLKEEVNADKKLTKLAETSINQKANEHGQSSSK